MPKYVVYEIWTKSRIVEAKNESDAYDVGEPEPLEGFSLSNWHVQEISRTSALVDTGLTHVGGLNYRQIVDEVEPRGARIG